MKNAWREKETSGFSRKSYPLLLKKSVDDFVVI
jgi:hypothetical protein